PPRLTAAIDCLFLKAHLENTTIYLGLWYVHRLPKQLWRNQYMKERMNNVLRDNVNNGDEECAVFRLVVLGCLLANKWLDDSPHWLKSWCACEISRISLETLNNLERLALSV
ncbi:hypothetical protein B0H13DRAFT_1541980, partial [Mycena leptocephala]